MRKRYDVTKRRKKEKERKDRRDKKDTIEKGISRVRRKKEIIGVESKRRKKKKKSKSNRQIEGRSDIIDTDTATIERILG